MRNLNYLQAPTSCGLQSRGYIKKGGRDLTENGLYKKFEALAEEHGESAYEICKSTGIDTSTITRWKQNQYTPKIDKLKRIADHFGISVTYFIE